jgi:hypothetical protein
VDDDSDDFIISNTLTELALVLLFAFGMIAAVYQFNVSLPRAADPGVRGGSGVGPNAGSSPLPPDPVFARKTLRVNVVDEQGDRYFQRIEEVRANATFADPNPCFVWIRDRDSTPRRFRTADFGFSAHVTASTGGQAVQSNTVVGYIDPTVSISALGIFVTPDTTVSPPTLIFEAQARLDIVRGDFLPTRAIWNRWNDAKNRADYLTEFIGELNTTVRGIPPSTRFDDVIRPILDFMRDRSITCGFHVDLHGAVARFNDPETESSFADALVHQLTPQTPAFQRELACPTLAALFPAKKISVYRLSGTRRVLRSGGNLVVAEGPAMADPVAVAVCQAQRDLLRASVPILRAASPPGGTATAYPNLFWHTIRSAHPREL